MPPTASTPPAEPVVVPAGAPIRDAAGWVGAACWAELRLHEVLTGWLASETEPATALGLWSVRSERAGLAEAWHRRLPELRELPRAGFVTASRPEVGSVFDDLADLADLVGPGASVARAQALAAVLDGLLAGYRARVGVAVGPADGPVAVTLRSAIDATAAELATLAALVGPDRVWVERVAAAGGLP